MPGVLPHAGEYPIASDMPCKAVLLQDSDQQETGFPQDPLRRRRWCILNSSTSLMDLICMPLGQQCGFRNLMRTGNFLMGAAATSEADITIEMLTRGRYTSWSVILEYTGR